MSTDYQKFDMPEENGGTEFQNFEFGEKEIRLGNQMHYFANISKLNCKSGYSGWNLSQFCLYIYFESNIDTIDFS